MILDAPLNRHEDRLFSNVARDVLISESSRRIHEVRNDELYIDIHSIEYRLIVARLFSSISPAGAFLESVDDLVYSTMYYNALVIIVWV